MPQDGIDNLLIGHAEEQLPPVDASRRVVLHAQFGRHPPDLRSFLFHDALRVGYSPRTTSLRSMASGTDAYRGELFGQYDFQNGSHCRADFWRVSERAADVSV